jgi:hypothetical protein
LAAAIAVVATTAAGAWNSQPALRPSYELTSPSEHPPDNPERALLRLEWRAAQSSVDEAAAVRELLERVQRVSDTSAELQSIFISMPAAPPSAAAPAPALDAAPLQLPVAANGNEISASPAAEDDETPDWLPIAGSIGIAVLVGLWWLRRRQLRTNDADEVLPSPTIALPSPPGNGWDKHPGEPTDRETWPAESDPSDVRTLDEGELSFKLAEIMLSMGLTQGAARTLEEHVRTHPRQALYHWLKLLDIYRSAGLRAEFDQATDRLCRQFNVAPPDWQTDEPEPLIPSLEKYPHIRERLTDLWPRAECADYLQHLLEDNRAGTRTGFGQRVAEEILLLLSILRGYQTGLATSTN